MGIIETELTPKGLTLIMENRAGGNRMADLVFIGAILVFFLASNWLIKACERLKR
jgi:hypothetical protein